MKTEKQSSIVPKLRFPGFTDDLSWDYATVAELVETITPPKKLLTSSYRLEGRFPIIDQSRSEVCGWTDDDDAVITKPLPVIVFGDHTCVLKFVQQPFAQGADGVKIIRPISSVSTEYLFQQLSHRPLVMEQYKRHFSTLKNKHVCFPCLKSGEQQKIADCLGSLDDLTATQEQKLEALRQHKQGLMQQLFPQPGETVPRLRFPEFQSLPGWGFHMLSSVSEVNPKNDGLPKRFSYIDLESVRDGKLHGNKEIDRDSAPSRAQRLLRRKDIIYQSVRPYQRNNLFFNIEDGSDYVASTGYVQLRAHESPEFLYQFLHTDSFVSSVLARCTGSNYPAINHSELSSIPVLLPRKGEQQKIADCLGSLDDLISAHEQKLESLRQHKQGLMQQLFPTTENL